MEYDRFYVIIKIQESVNLLMRFADSQTRENIAREYIPTIAENGVPSNLSRVSAPPLRPEDTVGRVMLFGHIHGARIGRLCDCR